MPPLLPPLWHKWLCNGSHIAGPQESPTPEVKRGVQVEARGALLWLFLLMFPVAGGRAQPAGAGGGSAGASRFPVQCSEPPRAARHLAGAPQGHLGRFCLPQVPAPAFFGAVIQRTPRPKAPQLPPHHSREGHQSSAAWALEGSWVIPLHRARLRNSVLKHEKRELMKFRYQRQANMQNISPPIK